VRILIAHSFYRIPGGEDRYVKQQMDLLGAHHDVELLSARNEDLEGGLRTASRMVFSPGMRRSVEKTLERFRPDVVHLHNPYPSLGPAVHLSARRLRMPIVMTVHNYRLRCPNGYLFTEGSVCHRCVGGNTLNAVIHHCFPSRSQAAAYAATVWAHRYVLKLHDMVDVFVAPSEFIRRQLVSWGFPDDRIELVRNFTDVAVTAESRPGRYGAYVGRLSSEKGLDLLLRGLKLAGDPEFVVVGDGPLRAELQTLTEALRLQRTRFEGRVAATDVERFLRAARFIAFPSRSNENAPLAALEALAAGRPLLVANIGGLPELVDGGAGLAFRPGDEHDLARGLSRLMDDDHLCESLAESARRHALEKFSPGRHRARLEAVYGKAVTAAAGRV
jgi:glycosyltransferase involved in cell wall biosynthesis